MDNFTRLQQLTQDTHLPPRDRLLAFVQFARIVRDPTDVLAYVEEIGLQTNTAIYRLALAELAENEGDLPQALAILQRGKEKLGEEEMEVVDEYIRVVEERMEEWVLEQIENPSKRRMRQRRCVSRINGRSHLQINGYQLYIDPIFRKHHRVNQLIQAFHTNCTSLIHHRKLQYQAQLLTKPFSWISRDLKPFKIRALEESLPDQESKFSTPNRPKASRLSSKGLEPTESYSSKVLLDSPQILRELFKKSPNFPKVIKRVIATTPAPRSRTVTTLPIECIRTAAEQQCEFSFNNAMIEDEESTSQVETGQLSLIIRESQEYFHEGEKSLEEILSQMDEKENHLRQSWHDLDMTFASKMSI